MRVVSGIAYSTLFIFYLLIYYWQLCFELSFFYFSLSSGPVLALVKGIRGLLRCRIYRATCFKWSYSSTVLKTHRTCRKALSRWGYQECILRSDRHACLTRLLSSSNSSSSSLAEVATRKSNRKRVTVSFGWKQWRWKARAELLRRRAGVEATATTSEPGKSQYQ